MKYSEFILRIALSVILGFLIGVERQLTGHTAGIRINVLICMGTNFFMLLPMLYESPEVFRVASAIVSGVGFLCSGVIFKNDGGVRGINTAATLWCTAAIGVLASTGKYLFAVFATLALIISNLLFRVLSQKINPALQSDESEKQYRISIACMEENELEIRSMLINGNPSKTLYLINLESSDVTGGKVEIRAEYTSSGRAKNHVLEAMVGKALGIPTVISAGWEII